MKKRISFAVAMVFLTILFIGFTEKNDVFAATKRCKVTFVEDNGRTWNYTYKCGEPFGYFGGTNYLKHDSEKGFDGWYTEDHVKVEMATIVPDQDTLTLHAEWVSGATSIQLITNNGKHNGMSEIFTFAYDFGNSNDFWSRVPEVTRVGYDLTGWEYQYMEKYVMPITNVKYTAVPMIDWSVGYINVCRLFAQWKPKQYTVYFDYNDGNPNKESKIVTYRDAYGSLPKSDREGYEIIWSKTKVGYNPVYEYSTVSTAEDHTLYAVYRKRNIKVSYDKNATDAQGYMNYHNVSYGAKLTLYANRFTRPGYTFVNWNTKPDGSGISYDDKHMFDSFTSDNNEVVLYAQWEHNHDYEFVKGKNYTVIAKCLDKKCDYCETIDPYKYYQIISKSNPIYTYEDAIKNYYMIAGLDYIKAKQLSYDYANPFAGYTMAGLNTLKDMAINGNEIIIALDKLGEKKLNYKIGNIAESVGKFEKVIALYEYIDALRQLATDRDIASIDNWLDKTANIVGFVDILGSSYSDIISELGKVVAALLEKEIGYYDTYEQLFAEIESYKKSIYEYTLAEWNDENTYNELAKYLGGDLRAKKYMSLRLQYEIESLIDPNVRNMTFKDYCKEYFK